MAELVVGVARDVEHARRRMRLAELRRELRAAHLRHDHVGEQQVHLAHLGRERECLLAVGGVDHVVAGSSQDVAHEDADLGFILDEDDPLGAAVGIVDPPASPRALSSTALDDGK